MNILGTHTTDVYGRIQIHNVIFVSNQHAYSRGTPELLQPIYRCRDSAAGRRDKFVTSRGCSLSRRCSTNSRDSVAMHARDRIPKSIATAMATGTREKGNGRSIQLNSVDPLLTSPNKCTNSVRVVENYEYAVCRAYSYTNPGGKACRWRFPPTLGTHRRFACLTFRRPEPSCRYHANGDFPRFVMQRIRMCQVSQGSCLAPE